MKTNSVTSKFNSSDKFSKKTNPRMTGQSKGHAHPDSNFSSRKGSGVKQPTGTSKMRTGMQGLSVGQKVPMDIFQQSYKKPNNHGMPQVVEANVIKKKTKSALKGPQRKFFGL